MTDAKRIEKLESQVASLRARLAARTDQLLLVLLQIDDLKQAAPSAPAAPAPSPASGEPNMRHPKIQALIGAKARREIELRLVEQLLDDPDCAMTSMDMEHWHGLHDKLREKLTAAAQPALARPLTDEQIKGVALDEELLLICDDMDSLIEITRAIESAHGIAAASTTKE